MDRENPARWRGHLDKLLPAKSKMRKGKGKHQPALPYKQIGALMADLLSRPGLAARALEFTIFTGARSNEVLGAQWAEIDLAERVWTIPPERVKGDREHRVPLSDRAMSIIRGTRPDGENTAQKYIFPGAKPGRPLSNMAMLELIRRMNAERDVVGLPRYVDPKQGGRDVVSHGFRSTFRDWATERTNFPREIAEVAIAHTVGDETERAYQRGDLFDKRRRLMTAWAEFCGKPSSSGKVVPPRKEFEAAETSPITST